MNIFELADKSGASLRTLRKIEKLLKGRPIAASDPVLDSIRAQTNRVRPLSVSQYMALIDRPELIDALGSRAERIEQELEAIGDAQGEAAPREVTLHLQDASKGNPKAAAIIAQWMHDALPDQGNVPHAYLALRLLYGVPENVRRFALPVVPRAMQAAKRQAPLAGCWRIVETGSMRATEYFKPMPLDL
jgi:hypothetical protein